MGGWLEKVKIKLNSTQVVVEVEVKVRFELGNYFTSPNATPFLGFLCTKYFCQVLFVLFNSFLDP